MFKMGFMYYTLIIIIVLVIIKQMDKDFFQNYAAIYKTI